MNPRILAGPRLEGGFTLMECIIVILVLAIASVGIAKMQGHMFSSQSSLTDIQVRTRLMEECAEQYLTVRRNTLDGYSVADTPLFDINVCDGVPGFGSYATVTVHVTAVASGDALAPLCPASGTCKTATFSQAGLTPLTVMLANY